MRYLITGITGTLGQAVASLASTEGHEVLGLSRDEQKQRQLPKLPGLSLRLADVRDADRISDLVFEFEPDVLFHFAALKCVDTLEADPEECIKTNVIGTQNIFQAQKIMRVPRVILSATDKGAYPINAYGNSKALAEKIILQEPRNVVCRYGNVIASRGSVIPMFVESLKRDKRVLITSDEMTRFLIPMEEAARFVWKQRAATQGGVKIPPMRATKITALAIAVADCLGIERFDTVVTGIRPGEKIHECLRMAHEEGGELHSNTATQFTHQELVSLILPTVRALV